MENYTSAIPFKFSIERKPCLLFTATSFWLKPLFIGLKIHSMPFKSRYFFVAAPNHCIFLKLCNITVQLVGRKFPINYEWTDELLIFQMESVFHFCDHSYGRQLGSIWFLPCCSCLHFITRIQGQQHRILESSRWGEIILWMSYLGLFFNEYSRKTWIFDKNKRKNDRKIFVIEIPILFHSI